MTQQTHFSGRAMLRRSVAVVVIQKVARGMIARNAEFAGVGMMTKLSILADVIGEDGLRVDVRNLKYSLGTDELVTLIRKTSEGVPLEGITSPLSEVTLTDKTELNIPEDAAHYCFLYPIKGLKPSKELGDDPAACGFLFGGFVYFDRDLRFRQFNALALTASDITLTIRGPVDGNRNFAKALTQKDRFADVTIKELRGQGFAKFAWVRPSEVVLHGDLVTNKAGVSGSQHLGAVKYPHGAFVYRMDGKEHPQYFPVVLQHGDRQNMITTIQAGKKRGENQPPTLGGGLARVRSKLGQEDVQDRGHYQKPGQYKKPGVLGRIWITKAAGLVDDDASKEAEAVPALVGDQWLNAQLDIAKKKLDFEKDVAEQLANHLKSKGLGTIDSLLRATRACYARLRPEDVNGTAPLDAISLETLRKWKRDTSFLDDTVEDLCKPWRGDQPPDPKTGLPTMCGVNHKTLLKTLIRAAIGHYLMEREASDRVYRAYERVIKKEALEEPCCSWGPDATRLLSRGLFLGFKLLGNVLPNFPWCFIPDITSRYFMPVGARQKHPFFFWILTAVDFLEPLGFAINATIAIVILHLHFGDMVEAHCRASNLIMPGTPMCSFEFAYGGWALAMTILKSLDRVYELFVAKGPSIQISLWLLMIFQVKVPSAMLDEENKGLRNADNPLRGIDLWLFVVISILLAYGSYFTANWFLNPTHVPMCEPEYVQTNTSDPNPATRCPPPYYFPLESDPHVCCTLVDQSFEWDVLIARAGGALVSAYLFVRFLANLFFEADPEARDATARNRRDTDQRLADSACFAGQLSPSKWHKLGAADTEAAVPGASIPRRSQRTWFGGAVDASSAAAKKTDTGGGNGGGSPGAGSSLANYFACRKQKIARRISRSASRSSLRGARGISVTNNSSSAVSDVV